MLVRKAKHVLRDREAELRNLALDLRLLPSHTGYTRFIVLARSRTGSNLLRSLLRTHPGVLVFGELFRNAEQPDWDVPGYQTTPQALAAYQADPVRFLQARVFRRVPKSVQAVGFKLFYYHARSGPGQAIWPYLQGLPGLKVLHLRRRNILRTHLSRARAAASNRWVNLSGEKEELGPVRLSAADLLADFEQTRQWERAADEAFAPAARLNLTYEDLAHDYASEMARVWSFLCLPAAPATPATHKQTQQPLAAAISNYAELKQSFAGTEWASFFEE